MILAIGNAGLFLLGIGLSVAANLIWKQKLPGPLKDDSDSTGSERGTYIPIVIGRARVAPVIGFISKPYVAGSAANANGAGSGGALAGIARYVFGLGDAGGKRQDDGGGSQVEWFYKVWHIICVGPVQQIPTIWCNGNEVGTNGLSPVNSQSGAFRRRPIFSFPIRGSNSVGTAVGHPCFGFPDQDIQTELRDAMNDLAGLSGNDGAPLSRWGAVASAFYRDFRVGTIRQLPVVEYEVVCVPRSGLKGSKPMLPERWLHSDDLPFRRCAPDTNQSQSDGKIGLQLTGRPGNFLQTSLNPQADEFNETPYTWKAGDVIYVTGPWASLWYGRPGIYLTIYRAEQTTLYADNNSTIISLGYPADELGIEILNRKTFTNSQSRIYKLERQYEEGCNLAHALDQLMFAQYPYGAGLPREHFDMESLEELGRRVDRPDENLPGSVVMANGEDIQAVVAAIMQDCGVMLSWDPLIRKYRFQLIRDNQTQVVIPARMLVDSVPEIVTDHNPQQLNGITFTYRQRDRNYRKGSFSFDDEGDAVEREALNGDREEIRTVTSFLPAQRVAIRRSLEVIPRHSIAKATLMGPARILFAGQPGRLDDESLLPYPIRIDSIRYDIRSGRVEVGFIQDLFGNHNQSSNLTNYGGMSDEIDAIASAITTVGLEGVSVGSDRAQNEMGRGVGTAPDFGATREPPLAQVDFAELPRYLSNEQRARLLVGWIRGNDQVVNASIFASPNGESYTLIGTDLEPTTGGLLVNAIGATGWVITDQSIVVEPVGPDLANLGAFVSDDTSWKLGRLIMKIDDELFYVKGVTAHPNGDGTFYVNSAIRARLATARAAHSAGAKVTFMIDRMIRGVSDVLLQPGRTLYFKILAAAQDELASIAGGDLSEATAITHTIRGDYLRPLDPTSLRLRLGNTGILSSADAEIRWDYRNPSQPKTGAGMQGAGDPTHAAPVDGEFVLKIWDGNPSGAGAVVRTVTGLTVAEYDYTSAMRTTDGINTDDFWVTVYGVRAGYASSTLTLGPITQV